MALTLSNIKNRKRKKKRLGRGLGSGHGTYSTRGQKGQRARSGGSKGLKLKGFKQNLLNQPKYKGMKSPRPKAQIVPVSALDKNFQDGDKVTPGTLLEKKLVMTLAAPVKILSKNKEDKLTKKVEVFGCAVSASAKALIEKAGGMLVTADEAEK